MSDANHLIAALRVACEGRSDADFCTDSAGGITTYGALWDGAARMAASLIALGVEPGDRVALQVEKSVEALQCYLGTVMVGGVHLPLNTAYTSAEVEYFLTDAAPRVFVCDPKKYATLAPVAQSADITHILTLDAEGKGTAADAMVDALPMSAPVPRTASDIAAFLYTSGTTGRSKGAMLTHGNLASNARALSDLWEFTESDVLIHALPLFHTHGLFVAVNVTLSAGSHILLHQSFDAEAILADFPRATTLMGVPTFYTRLLNETGLTRDAVRHMRLFVSGSAPMLTSTHAQWQDRTGHTVLERYGMTETCMNTSNPYEGVRKPGTVGLPLPGVEVRLTGTDGAPVAEGEPGDIEVRGPNVFAGYWNMPDKTAQDMRPGGWFATGDIGTIDADGYYTIVGRSKDLIISGGYNIYPKEIETLVDAVPGVSESAVFGVPHPDFGESVAVAVVRAQGAELTEETLLAAVSSELARYKHPRRIHFLDALPRNAMGKVQKADLRQTFGNVS